MEPAVLFLSLVFAVNLAVYCWLGALGVRSGKDSDRNEVLLYLLIAVAFTAQVAVTLYVLAFVVRPFG